jgi:hypothetical protein
LETIALEKERLQCKSIAEKNNLCHFYGSLYHKHISQWMTCFPKHQFLILTSDSFSADTATAMNRVFGFLGLSPVAIDTSRRHNKTSGVKNKFLQQVLLNREHWLRRSTRWLMRPFRTLIIRTGIIEKVAALNKKQIDNPPLSGDDWVKSSEYFIEDVKLLDRDFHIRFREFGDCYDL